jgi:pimeloyl-ACP methyl ester carboxylesterase
MRRKLLGAVVAAVVVSSGVGSLPSASAQTDEDHLPMVFVHGFMGSGSQFEAQALRFASNGYPAELIYQFEHNSLAYPDSEEEVFARLDEQIADMQEAHGADSVYLLAHSQGTGLSQNYLNSDPDRAASVAKYVNLDGAAGAVPDEVEALAVWGEPFMGDEEMPGATNVRFPDQSHTEVVNSPESFVEMFTFLAGEAPTTHHVVASDDDEIEIAGRVPLFPENVGAAGATLELWKVEPETGQPAGAEPEATFELEGDASWGPVTVERDGVYAFAIVRDTGTHFIHLQQFVRSNYWIRLLTSEPGGLADSFWETSDDHANLVVFRNKEQWGDQGEASDSLAINGENVLNEATSPRDNRTIGIFLHDEGLDGESNLAEPVSPSGLPFLTGVDLSIPAASPPDGTVSVVSDPRLGDGPESVCVPNWASNDARISIQFNSFHHFVDAEGNPAEGPVNPDCAPAADRPGDEEPPSDDEPIATTPAAQPVAGVPSFTG